MHRQASQISLNVLLENKCNGIDVYLDNEILTHFVTLIFT